MYTNWPTPNIKTPLFDLELHLSSQIHRWKEEVDQQHQSWTLLEHNHLLYACTCIVCIPINFNYYVPIGTNITFLISDPSSTVQYIILHVEKLQKDQGLRNRLSIIVIFITLDPSLPPCLALVSMNMYIQCTTLTFMQLALTWIPPPPLDSPLSDIIILLLQNYSS